MTMTARFEIRVGRWGTYVFDRKTGNALTNDEVLALLNAIA